MAAVNRGRDIIVALLHLALWSQLGVLTRIYLDKLFSTCNLLEAWAGLQCMPDVGRWALLIAGMKGIFPQMSRQALGWPTESSASRSCGVFMLLGLLCHGGCHCLSSHRFEISRPDQLCCQVSSTTPSERTSQTRPPTYWAHSLWAWWLLGPPSAASPRRRSPFPSQQQLAGECTQTSLLLAHIACTLFSVHGSGAEACKILERPCLTLPIWGQQQHSQCCSLPARWAESVKPEAIKPL